MDDDFSLSSIWGAPTDPAPIPSLKSITLAPPLDDFPPAPSSSQGEADGDDDFDDFGTAPSGAPSEIDDDFGDFGDFGEAEASGTPADFGDFGQLPTAGSPIPDSGWEALKLDPLPSRTDLRSQLDNVLGPVLDDDISEYTTGEDVRQVEGLSQILVTAERYVSTKHCGLWILKIWTTQS